MGVFQQFPYSNFHEINLDQMIKILREMQDEWAATKAQWASYKEFIDNYFANLDVSREVLAAMRIFAVDGTLNKIMDPTIASEVSAWLADHITPTSPAVDESLTVAGAAADAKAVGTKFDFREVFLSTGIAPVDETLQPTENHDGYFYSRNGSLTKTGGNDRAYQFTIQPNTWYRVSGSYGWDECGCQWLNNGVVISDAVYGEYIQETRTFSGVYKSPANANQLRVNGFFSTVNTAKCGVQKANFEPAVKDFSIEEIIPEWIENAYIQTNGIVNSLQGSKYAILKVNPGDIYIIQSCNNWQGKAWAVVDINGLIIEQSTQNEGYTDKVLQIPRNGAKLYVNAFSTDGTRNLRNYSAVYKVMPINNNDMGSLQHTNDLHKWAAIGDSLTDTITLQTGNYQLPTYTNFVSKWLNLPCLNLGKGGTGYVATNSGADLNFADRALTMGSDIDVVTVFGSLNDVYIEDLQIGTPADAAGDSTVYGKIKECIENIYSVNPEMLIIIATPCPFPAGNGINTGSTLYQITQEYVTAIINTAKMYSLPVLDLFHTSGLRPWDQSFKTAHYLNGDGQHLNSAAHRKYTAPKFADAIRTVLNIK